MPVIPSLYGQFTATFSGLNVPRGAACTMGVVSDGSDAPAVVLANTFEAWEDFHIGASSADVTLESLTFKQGPDDIGPFATVALGTVGDQGSTTMTSQVAWNVKKVTASGGRKNRGRMFWPGVPEAAFDDSGNIEASFLTQITTVGAALLSALTTAGHAPVILHSSLADTPTEITALVPGARTITQRRRNRTN